MRPHAAVRRPRRMGRRVIICGSERGTGPRSDTDCPNRLHDWPLPIGYSDAADEARWRLRHGWANNRGPDCGLYGRRPGQLTDHERREAT